MKTEFLSAVDLDQYAKLHRNKAFHLERAAEIQRKIDEYQPEGLQYIPSHIKERLKRTVTRSIRQGDVKRIVLQTLATAGPDGLTISEIRSHSKLKYGSIASFIYPNWSSIKGLAKVGRKFIYTSWTLNGHSQTTQSLPQS